MIKKIEKRLNKEIEKILDKKELSITDFIFLRGELVTLKFEKDKKEEIEKYDGVLDKGLSLLSNLRKEN